MLEAIGYMLIGVLFGVGIKLLVAMIDSRRDQK